MSDTLDLGPLSKGRRARTIRCALGWRQVDVASYARVDTTDVRACERDEAKQSEVMSERVIETLYREAEAQGILKREKQLELAAPGRERA